MEDRTKQKEMPLISVVIKAFNIEKELLDRCVSSVVQQTYTNLQRNNSAVTAMWLVPKR